MGIVPQPWMRLVRVAGTPLLAVLLLASCATPPDSAYVKGGSAHAAQAGVALGIDAAGKKCEQQAQSTGEAYIFCGEWSQPSAKILAGAAGPPIELATSSLWRTVLDRRFDCGEPHATSILGGEPAALLDCRRKIGGWPQIGLVALVAGRAYFADGLQPELSVMERSIGIQAGKLASEAVSQAPPSQALAAERLAAQSFSSSDISQYEQLMQAGAQANRTQNYDSAEKAYRAALALQQKALGANNANTAAPLMHQAMQLSNQGRYAEADALFSRAQLLAAQPGLGDKTARPRLTHYRALDLLNQNKLPQALDLAVQAEAQYSALLTPALLATRSSARTNVNTLGAAALADRLADQQGLADPQTEAALMGVVEVRRNEANILKWQGHGPESEIMAQSAVDLARARGWSQPVVTARLLRTSAEIASLRGDYQSANSQFAQSAAAFNRAMPGARPAADTEFLRAAALIWLDRPDDAVEACRNGAHLLQVLKAGTSGELIEPCLSAYAAAAAARPQQRQSLLAEMFETAQLGQTSVTSQQIARATARLSENARDNRVGDAIRRRETAGSALAELYRQRDTSEEARKSGGAANVAEAAELDRKINEAQANEADSDVALQAASPNYGQLVQQVVRAQEILDLLRPNEAFVATMLGNTTGWSFLLHQDEKGQSGIVVAPIAGGTQRMAELVKKTRASIEPTSGSTPPPFDVVSAQAIYAAVLGGFSGALDGAASLTVAPSGPLLAIPFAALLTGAADPANLAAAPFLIKRMTVTHVPAAANFVALRKVARSQARNPWFGFGDFHPVTLRQAQASFPAGPCADSARLLAGLPPLPGARAELEEARMLESAGTADQLLGLGFTAQAVRAASLRDFRVLHFATHALLPTDLVCQDEPAIVTSTPLAAADASGALLSASRVAQLQLDADTVILSACNTGGPNGGTAGESLSGLARSFFYAGARSLLVTHWPVNDQITRILVVTTLKHYKEDAALGLAAALGASQRALIAQAHGDLALLAHPYYWAPLALIGESSPGGVLTSGKVAGVTASGMRVGSL